MKSITYQVIVFENGIRQWYLNGEVHREDGPAVEHADGTRSSWINGRLHRTDGPAIEYADGEQSWWINGKRHRVDGPAVENADGRKLWYINGEPLSEDEFLAKTQPAKELTVAEIEQLLGHKVKVVK